MERKEPKDKSSKADRVLWMYDLLMRGKVINKADAGQKFGVDEKSIQRDLDDIRCYLNERVSDFGIQNELIYDRRQNGYRLEQEESMRFSNEEVLAITKILLDSRAFTKDEMMQMLDKLIECCVPPQNQKLVSDLIANERYHYIEPQHHRVFIDKMWQIGQAIHENRYIEIGYERMKDKKVVKRKVQPQAILFSEFYFYLAAYIEDIDREKEFDVANDMFPTIYRMDRIRSLTVLEEHFSIPYSERFEEGEYRKRIQFMYGGKLQRTKFWYRGLSVEAVLDRLPTAKILREEEGRFLISAETFGKGIEMWLRSQGDNVELVK
jgi:hypothetical protein|uniref:helix-turn-helix transcriptional regulator n=1 Tax=Roseburia sp. TaxID=2049040 RepID=UPI003FEFA4CB